MTRLMVWLLVPMLAAGCASPPPDRSAKGLAAPADSSEETVTGEDDAASPARRPDPDAPSPAGDEPAVPNQPQEPDPETDFAAGTSSEQRTLRADSFERFARNVTMRIRAVGVDGVGVGSGFAIDPHVFITNQHVIDGACVVEASTWDGETVEAEMTAVAMISDLAVVRTATPLPVTVELASTVPAVGDPVIAVGYPLGGRLQVTSGELARTEPAPDGAGVDLVTSAPIEQGNSGGPLFNDDGQVTGVIYAVLVATGESLAIPISTLEALLADQSVWRSPTGMWC